jgi:hypothetical protein
MPCPMPSARFDTYGPRYSCSLIAHQTHRLPNIKMEASQKNGLEDFQVFVDKESFLFDKWRRAYEHSVQFILRNILRPTTMVYDEFHEAKGGNSTTRRTHEG